ncbi:MAG: hypothetical protein JJT76_15540 [Clostridiaceae bacterium]|nr:hypothetical protein [Clostridiaceae bacterium]
MKKKIIASTLLVLLMFTMNFQSYALASSEIIANASEWKDIEGIADFDVKFIITEEGWQQEHGTLTIDNVPMEYIQTNKNDGSIYTEIWENGEKVYDMVQNHETDITLLNGETFNTINLTEQISVIDIEDGISIASDKQLISTYNGNTKIDLRDTLFVAAFLAGAIPGGGPVAAFFGIAGIIIDRAASDVYYIQEVYIKGNDWKTFYYEMTYYSDSSRTNEIGTSSFIRYR